MKILSNDTAVNNLFNTLKKEKNKNNNLKETILKLDDKLQRLLLWSNISALWACVILIFTIAKIYANFAGSHPIFLALSLGGIVAVFGLLIFLVWKSCTYKDKGFTKASKTYLDYQVGKISGQLKLVSAYLLIYTAVLVASGCFFSMDINNGLNLLLKVTLPLSIVIYGIGLYFIFVFSVQKRKIHLLGKQVNSTGGIEKLAGN